MSVDVWYSRLEVLNQSIRNQEEIIKRKEKELKEKQEELRLAELILRNIEKDKFFITQEIEKALEWKQKV